MAILRSPLAPSTAGTDTFESSKSAAIERPPSETRRGGSCGELSAYAQWRRVPLAVSLSTSVSVLGGWHPALRPHDAIALLRSLHAIVCGLPGSPGRQRRYGAAQLDPSGT